MRSNNTDKIVQNKINLTSSANRNEKRTIDIKFTHDLKKSTTSSILFFFKS